VKNKVYISLLWIGLAIASTTGYAKPTHAKHAHAKHASVSAKGVKMLSRHAVGRKKHAADNPFSGISTSRTRTKLHFTHGTRKTDRRSSFISAENTFPEQNNDDSLLELTESNERIRSFITAHHNDNEVDRPAHYNHETPGHITSVHGTINTSLSLTGQRTGLSNELILQLTNIFAWDIDFAENLHQGDQFTVVYEETIRGNNSSDSQIIAAEFVNQGRILTAIRYEDGEGQVNYYSPEGKPMRKAFLSTPVDFIRISSGFDAHRKHPILNRIRAHRGVDYAARTGTPVKAAGDGEVIFRGRKGGYGQVMIVKHGERYETLYAHLSDFKRGLENGDQVKQGEIIGYVGQTGLATGPHLHYEFRVDGVHRNPETLNLAQSSPLHAEALADFKAQTQPVLAQLNQAKAKSLFAKNQYEYN
jgi:murein DD-endopeptidase MepM/ murein hydrolase activator NlpD